MNTHKLLFIAFALTIMGLLTTSCANDVDINTEYQEITIVYGLLNQSQDRQYIKITKAFQTEGNVIIAAKDPKNSMYDPKDLEVWLDEYFGADYLRTIYLDSVVITNKDSGEFYYPNEIVYATPVGIQIKQTREYKLNIKVKSTGRLIEGKTFMVQDFSIKKPSAWQNYASFTGNYNQKVEWKSAKNGILHQLTIRYFYTDIPASGPRTSHSVDMNFGLKRASNANGGETIIQEFNGNSFYQNLAAHIDLPEAGMKRYSDSLYYIFDVADEDFTIYVDINGPSNSIVQERPAYSNITNGIGLFSARYTKIRYFAGLTPPSLDTLIHGQYTNHLGFIER